MAIEKKKGTSGQAKNFVTRTQAVRKLQISLPDFRRLCIFKGIFPREPRHRKRANKSSTPDTTFYYTKDIQYLLHEPLLNKFREHKIVARKISRALGRGELRDAQRLERNLTPRLTLNHIIKERYPTFADALRDLDDALSTLSLFASLPSTAAVPPKTIALCQRLCHEFQHYIIVSRSLRKSFLSIKGIYYQADVHGQDILWVVPYKFVQSVAQDVDFRIMGTFVEFYTTLLSFVNYRLYTSLGLVYPPKFDEEKDENGAELSSYRIEGQPLNPLLEEGFAKKDDAALESATKEAQVIADRLGRDSNIESDDPTHTKMVSTKADQDLEATSDKVDSFKTTDPTADLLPQPVDSANVAASLFSKFTFYLSRETPRGPLEFILRAFGCTRIGWDPASGSGAHTSDENDARITHQVVDRPPIPAGGTRPDRVEVSEIRFPHTLAPGRIYIQPQWVWDCINAGMLLPGDSYSPGATLPPHLSPFVRPSPGVYNPLEALDVEEGDQTVASIRSSNPRKDENVIEGVKNIKEIADLADSGAEFADVADDLVTRDPLEDAESHHSDQDNSAGDWDGLSSGEDDAANVANLHQRELEAEVFGHKVTKPPSSLQEMSSKQQHKERHKTKEDEHIERRKLMLSRRKRKLFEKMQYSNTKRDEETEKLRNKRRKLEQEAAQAG